jgi:hypothetical protein
VHGAVLRIEDGRQLRERLERRVGSRVLIRVDARGPFFPAISTGAISSANRPDDAASPARRCDLERVRRPARRGGSRTRGQGLGRLPISWPQSGQRKPSRYMASTSSACPSGGRTGRAGAGTASPTCTPFRRRERRRSRRRRSREPESERLQRGGACLVHRERGHRVGNARPSRHLAGRVRPAARPAGRVRRSSRRSRGRQAGTFDRGLRRGPPSSAAESAAKDPPNFPMGVLAAERT